MGFNHAVAMTLALDMSSFIGHATPPLIWGPLSIRLLRLDLTVQLETTVHSDPCVCISLNR